MTAAHYRASSASTNMKLVPTESVQGLLDENSSLIVEILEAKEVAKKNRETSKSGEFAMDLDRKRKQLNTNLMVLAKWADESADVPPRPVVEPTAPSTKPEEEEEEEEKVMDNDEKDEKDVPITEKETLSMEVDDNETSSSEPVEATTESNSAPKEKDSLA